MSWNYKNKQRLEGYLATEILKYLLTENGKRLFITDMNWGLKSKDTSSQWSLKSKTNN